MTPAVSIVMATYNRSNVLAYAIRSVLQGSFQDWELLVVGDCCTDDSMTVVEGFADNRIRFINLETNYGEQTGPNNLGIELARGRYLAFLNHDDLWLPDHLQRSIDILEQGVADLIFGQGLLASDHPPHGLTGALCAQRQPYEPWMSVPASLWVMRHELAVRVGLWQPSWELRVSPSQGWLYRAYRQGARLIAEPDLSAVLIQSGARTNAYRDRQECEHKHWFSQLQNQAYFRQVLAAIGGQSLYEKQFNPFTALGDSLRSSARRLLLVFKVWPPSLNFWLKYWRKGAFLRELRRRRGLHDLGARRR